jgi:hypothetical protein
MSDSYNYQNESILDYLPNKVDLEEQLLMSSDIRERRTVEILPPNQALPNISATSMNNVATFKINSTEEWIDCMNANLVFQVSSVIFPSGTDISYNICVLDGRYSCIDRVTCTINGNSMVTQTSGFSLHRNAKYLNEAFIDNYVSDSYVLNPGNAKLCSVLKNSAPPTSQSFYNDLMLSPANFVKTATPSSANLYDACGVITVQNVDASTNVANGYGYRNSYQQDKGTQTVTIPLSELIGFFNIQKYLPLFLFGSGGIDINVYFSSPVNAFFTDCGKYTSATTPSASTYAPAPITSYSVSNIKMVVDFIQCSDVLNNSYKLKAQSPEGINLVFDDWIVQSNIVSNFSGGQQQMQCNLTTGSLKSLLFYQQSNTARQQNGWSNSNLCYLGLNNYSVTINNKQHPPTPLSSATDICLYNNRSRNVISNQLCNLVANNPYVFGRSEVGVTPMPGSANDFVPSVTAFMIYSNFEKILSENNQIIRNGADLKSGSSVITIKFSTNDDSSTTSPFTKILKSVLGSSNGSYTQYALLEFQRLFRIANGRVEVI